MGRRLIYIRPQVSGYLLLTTAWIAATGESDTTILNALNTFETDLIANSMSGDLIAYYPMVGGNATKHAFNFMNTSLYNLSFVGGWTHSATGALPNGTNAYANTGINGNSVLNPNNTHVSFYSRTNAVVGTRTSIGCYTTGSSPVLNLVLEYSAPPDSAIYLDGNSVTTQGAITSNTDSSGYYLGNKTSGVIGGTILDKNGTQIAANTVANSVSTYANTNVIISALRTNLNFDNKECAGATIGPGLNSTKRGQIYTMIQAFNTSLSRQV